MWFCQICFGNVCLHILWDLKTTKKSQVFPTCFQTLLRNKTKNSLEALKKLTPETGGFCWWFEEQNAIITESSDSHILQTRNWNGKVSTSVRNWHIHFIKMIKDLQIISGRPVAKGSPGSGGGAAVKFVAFWQLASWLRSQNRLFLVSRLF